MNRDRPSPMLPILMSCLALAILAGAAGWRWRADPPLVERRGLLMGTAVEIKAVARDGNRQLASAAVDRAFDEMARIERALSIYKPDSEVSRLNASASAAPVKVSDELYALLQRSISWHDATRGAFDITILPLKRLWAEAAREGKVPDEEAVQRARELVGASAIRLDPASRTVFFERPGMSVDLGGIAKGYAADRAAAVLLAHGVTAAIINAGGDLYCLGERAGGKAWVVAIQHPRDRSVRAYELTVTDRGVDTSGDYERYSMIAGKRYSHIIDPRTGMPVADAIVSATVVARDSLTADALATALCILGEPGLRIAETAGADALVLAQDADGSMRTMMTHGLVEKYGVTKDHT